MKPEHFAKHQHFVPCDAIYELRRGRARVSNGPDEIIRYVAEKGNTDEVYKNMLLSLLTVDDEPEPCKEKTDKNNEHDTIIRQLMEKGSIDVVYKNVLLSRLTVGDGPVPHKDKMDKNDVVEQKEKPVLMKKRKIADNLWVKQESEVAVQAQPVKIFGEQIGGKLKGVVKEEYAANEKNELKKENEKICQLRRLRRSCVTRNYCEDVGRVQLGEKHAVHGEMGLMEGLASKKIAVGDFAVKEEPDDCVETHVPIEGIHSRNSDGKYVKGQSSSKTVPEVEILDSDTVVKEGIFSPFIPSKQFHCSMADGEPQSRGLPSAADEFRKELLKVLRKPFDKAEYQKCREAFRVGHYNKHHPGLQRKLTRYRNKREKCLVLLRGFLFWLQNVAREGSFVPWKDEQCLAVELPTGSINL